MVTLNLATQGCEIMSTIQDWHNAYRQQVNILNYSIRNLFFTLFYQFSQSTLASKMRTHGRVIAATYDLFSVLFAWLFSYWILIHITTHLSINPLSTEKNSLFLTISCWKLILPNLALIALSQILLFRLYGLYRGFWRFASIQDLRKIIYTSILGGLTAWVVLQTNTAISIASSTLETFPAPILLIPPYVIALLYTGLLILFLSSARLFLRLAKDCRRLYQDYQRVIIIGAGNAGEGLVRDLLRNGNQPYKPVVFVDDDLRKCGREIHNIRVAGTIAELPKLISVYNIDLALIAIPSASSAKMRSIVEICKEAKIACYVLPSIKELASGCVSINLLRNISLEDLLGRYPVTYQWTSVATCLKDKTILVTGGGGSIGSELCRQIISLGDISRLIVLDNNEYNLYSIEMELSQRFPACQIHPVLLSVTDRTGIRSALKKYRPHIIFHAAAYKHVPLLEHQPRVAIYNNIIGTKIIAEEAAKAGVDTFVLISSDKAVNPTNIMGATKRAAEYFCQNLNDHAEKTQFITVRFGNVLGSAGSVIPLFSKQIETGGPVTVTHPDVTRFFMTIPEASQLILQAVFLGQGGEIFVLDMGDPIKIRYLAEQMIKLAGKVAEQDIKIIYTGLRPGEKLYEECFYSNEMLQPTLHSKILRARSQQRNFNEILDTCHKMAAICQTEGALQNEFMSLLKLLVPEYRELNDGNKKRERPLETSDENLTTTQ